MLVVLAIPVTAEEPTPIYKNVLSCDLGNLIAYIPVTEILYLYTVDFIPSFGFTYERRLNKLIGLRGKIDLLLPVYFYITAVFTDVGVHFYPGKRAPHGWYIGVAGNISFSARIFSPDDGGVAGGGAIYSGYQWVFPSQWVHRFGAGCRVVHSTWGLAFYPNFEVAFGYAF